VIASAAEATHQLLVPLVEFRSGLKTLQHMAEKPARFRRAQMALEFDGRFATCIGPGVAFSMNAQGDWPGRATFAASLMLSLHKVPPGGTPVAIRTDTRRIQIDTMSVPCNWQPAEIEEGASFVDLPEPMDRLHMLEMLGRYSKDELYRQGFRNHIRRAKTWRYRKIVDALEHLAELGVTYDDLAHVVEEALKRNAKG
jgi:hypothetical protein